MSDADFTAMDQIRGENVQFIAHKKFIDNPFGLARDLLAKIPQ